MTRILIVDDVDTLARLSQHLEPHGFAFEQVFRTADALGAVARFNPDAVLLDLHFPEDGDGGASTSGGRLLTEFQREHPKLPVLVWTTRLADPAIAEERFDVQPSGSIVKPTMGDEKWAERLAAQLHRAVDDAQWTSDRYIRELGLHIGGSAAMGELARQLRRVAPTAESVLIRGEAGTETELVARAAHKLSGRAGPLVIANMGSILDEMTPTLVAARLRRLLSTAEGGTVFLDQIDDLPAEAQAPLLHILEETPRPATGAGSGAPASARVIAATHRDLAAMAATGAFRHDLLIHLSAHDLCLPPLRERLDDLPALFYRFLAQANASADIPVQPLLRPELAAKLRAYGWPRNIAEFEAVIRRAVKTTRNNILLAADVDIDAVWSAPDGDATDRDAADGLPPPPGTPPAEAASLDEGLGEINARRARDAARVLELSPIRERWGLFKDFGQGLMVPVTRELVRKMRAEYGRRVTYDDLGLFLDDRAVNVTVANRIRKFISTRVRLPQIPENQ